MNTQLTTWISFKSAPKRHLFTQLDCFVVCLLCKFPVLFFFGGGGVLKCSTSTGNQNSAGIISWPVEEIEATDMKTRKLPTIPGRFHTKREAVD